jgi:transcriptional regulator with XRE-family HTH domain
MSDEKHKSLLEQLTRFTGQVAGQTLDAAKTTATLGAMFGENWLSTAVMKTFEPERLEAMAEAGHFLRDARETAGMSLKELAESLGIKDDSLLEDIESGDRVMPIELMLRTASLIARHDPIPFLIQFMRTYNPALGATLEQWGVMALPKQYERERRWINLFRQHDVLRSLDDEEYDRLVNYVDSATNLVLDVMIKEKEAAAQSAAAKIPETDAKPASTGRKPPVVEVEAVGTSAKAKKPGTAAARKKPKPRPKTKKPSAGKAAKTRTRPKPKARPE